MIKVIGVRFRTAGKIYFFDPVQFDVKRGDHVIVETARGVEYGTVVGGIKEVADDEVMQPLKPVLRIATPKDDKQEEENKVENTDNECLLHVALDGVKIIGPQIDRLAAYHTAKVIGRTHLLPAPGDRRDDKKDHIGDDVGQSLNGNKGLRIQRG